MLIAVSEFFLWAIIGLAIGFAGHWWKSHADRYPDILDKDSPALNIALTEQTLVNYAIDNRYDDAGFWEYYSLRNLAYYLALGLGGTLLAVYATAEGHAAARGAFCAAAGLIKLTPVFCP